MPRGVPFRSRAIEYVFEWCVLARAGILSMPAFVSFNLHENGGESLRIHHSQRVAFHGSTAKHSYGSRNGVAVADYSLFCRR